MDKTKFLVEVLPADNSSPCPVTNSITIDEAFERSGGFGKFQLVSAIINTLANCSAMFFFNSFTFLELRPQYMCQLTGTD